MNLEAKVLPYASGGISSLSKENETDKVQWWGLKHNNEAAPRVMSERMFYRDITASVSDKCLPD